MRTISQQMIRKEVLTCICCMALFGKFGCSEGLDESNVAKREAQRLLENAEKSMEHGEPVERAIAFLDEAIEMQPEYVAAWRRRGYLLLVEVKDYKHAIADCSTAIELDPDDPQLYLMRGAAWNTLASEMDGADHSSISNCRRHALADFQATIRLDPTNVAALGGRGYLWLTSGKYEEAIEEYSRVIEIDPRHARSHKHLATLFLWCPRSEYRDAQQATAHALKYCELLEWADDESYELLAFAFAESGKFGEAIRAIEKAIDIDPIFNSDKRRRMLSTYRSGGKYRPRPNELEPYFQSDVGGESSLKE